MKFMNPFEHNKPGPLRVDEFVRIFKIYSDGGIVIEKSYDVSTCDDISNGIRHMASKYYYIGNAKNMIEKWNKE